MENKRTGLKKIVGTVLILLFSMYTCRSLYLAFDKDSYSPIYAFLSLNIARLCVPLGCLFLLCERKVKQYDLVLVTLPLSYWLMQMVHSYGSYQGGGELTFLTSVIFVLLPTRVKKQIFQCVYQIIQLNNIISIILWIDFFYLIVPDFKEFFFMLKMVWKQHITTNLAYLQFIPMVITLIGCAEYSMNLVRWELHALYFLSVHLAKPNGGKNFFFLRQECSPFHLLLHC